MSVSVSSVARYAHKTSSGGGSLTTGTGSADAVFPWIGSPDGSVALAAAGDGVGWVSEPAVEAGGGFFHIFFRIQPRREPLGCPQSRCGFVVLSPGLYPARVPNAGHLVEGYSKSRRIISSEALNLKLDVCRVGRQTAAGDRPVPTGVELGGRGGGYRVVGTTFGSYTRSRSEVSVVHPLQPIARLSFPANVDCDCSRILRRNSRI